MKRTKPLMKKNNFQSDNAAPAVAEHTPMMQHYVCVKTTLH